MSSVLVLNKHWTPVNVTDKFSAVSKVYKGDARFVDHHYTVYDWDTWIDQYGTIYDGSMDVIRTPSLIVAVPKVIVVSNYSGYKKMALRITRRNVYLRDNGVCQYCGCTRERKDMNIDHVIPLSKDGPNDWTNVVLSCVSCNTRKANKSLQEVGFKLTRKPLGFYESKIRDHYESWKNFIGESR